MHPRLCKAAWNRSRGHWLPDDARQPGRSQSRLVSPPTQAKPAQAPIAAIVAGRLSSGRLA
jgi:hypothetical protein